MERLLDRYAAEIGMDPAEVRRRNMVQPEAMPYDNGLGWTYDSGDYPAALERALAMTGYHDLPSARRETADRGKLLGVGIGSFVAVCGVGPSTRMSAEGMLGGTWETANLRVHPTGEVTAIIGSTTTGQSHETTFAQIVAAALGIDVDLITVQHSDTARAPYGQGTYGSRSYSVGGPALHLAAQRVIEKMRIAAAAFFGVAAEKVTYADGKVFVQGDAEKSKSFSDMAMALWYGWNLPPGMEAGIDETVTFDPPDFNYPYGTHVAVVEIDKETGHLELVRYIAVNDVGTVGNPLIVRGQVEGSIVHGVGQALMEEAIYDSAGQLLTRDLSSYALPQAKDIPVFELDLLSVPSPHNPLGVKGAGEIATVPTAAAISNAVCDALRDYGIHHLDMPFTAEKLWHVIHSDILGQG
jgi:carbon-monoxide dehydrogenase large subunit